MKKFPGIEIAHLSVRGGILMSRFISWSDNAAAAKQGKGVAGEIDEFDRIEIEKSIDGSTVAIGDFLTSSKYANYGGSIEERSDYLQKNIIRTSMNLANPSTYRFSASYKDFVEKNETQPLANVGIYFSSPKEAASIVKKKIDRFCENHPEWTVDDILSIPWNSSEIGTLYHEGKFPEGNQTYSGAMSLFLPKKKETLPPENVGIYFNNPKEAASAVKENIDQFCETHPEWTAESILSIPWNRSEIRTLYYQGKFPDGDQSFSGAMSLFLPAS